MPLFCVGDTDQLLYRFSGANPELLTGGLDKWLPDIETVKLEINYRSRDKIIDSSQRLISHNYSGLGGSYPQGLMKDTKGIKERGEAVNFQMYESAEIEAIKTADTINELLADGYTPGDFFIGARTRAQLGYVEGALVRAGIKFINITGSSFWQSKHVADVIAYLRLAHDTSNREALERVYNIPSANHQYSWNDKAGRFKAGDYCPTRYLGIEFLAKINYDFNQIDNVLSAKGGWYYKTNDRDYAKFGPTKAQELQEFVYWLKSVLEDQISMVNQIIEIIIDSCYEKYLKRQMAGDEESFDAKLEDLATVKEIASRYASVSSFLSYVDEMIQVAEDAKNKDWGDYVVLSTIHKLKGLERKIVFGLGWCEGGCDNSGRDVGLLPHTFSLSEPPDFGLLPGGDMSPMQDERCIGFVLISRAIERCYLSGIKNYRSWNLEPSRFIYEMGLLDNEKD